ncbi:MAG: radical SAM protein [Candidatus Methanomethylicaceae archaeon]
MEIKKLRERLFVIYKDDRTFLLNTFPFAVYELSERADEDSLLVLTADFTSPTCACLNYRNYFNLELIITTRCNLACSYCHIREGGGYYGLPPMDMSDDVWKRALDFSFDYIEKNVVEEGSDFINLELYYLGGEPLLNFEAVQQSFLYAEELAELLSKRHNIGFGIDSAISTNGVLLNEHNVRFLAEKGFEISITIDGLHHDEHRVYPNGRGTLNDILRKFDIFRRLNYHKVKLFSVVPPNYANEIDKIIEFYQRNDLLSHAYRISIVPRAVTREDVVRGCSVPKIAFTNSIASAETFDEQHINEFASQVKRLFEQYRVDDRDLFKKMGGLIGKGGVAYRCAAGLWKFSVAPDGGIWPCHQLINVDGFSMGNVFEPRTPDNFELIQQKFRKRVVWETEPCKDCVLQTLCPPLVDCPARAFIEEGDLGRAPHVYCAIYKPYMLNRLDDLISEIAQGEE